MSNKIAFLSITRFAAVVAVAGALTAMPVSAQTVAGTSRAMLSSAAPAPDLNLADSSSSTMTADAPRYKSELDASSSSTMDAAEKDFNLKDDAIQPPPRRYGRPNYHDSNTNADGSSRYTFDVGGGLTIPTGNAHEFLHTSYAFQGGGGLNFNQRIGLLLQFEWDNLAFDNSTLSNQASVEGVGQLGGSSHIWSFTLDPIIHLMSGNSGGLYALVGGGFYHKTANFTVPTTGFYCDIFGDCFQYAANATIDKYTSNAGGAQGGLGFDWKLSRFSNERLFMEGKYVFVDNQPKALSATNLYPPNSHRTEYIPITFGIRW